MMLFGSLWPFVLTTGRREGRCEGVRMGRKRKRRESVTQGDKERRGEVQERRKRKCRGVQLEEEEQIGPFPMFTLCTEPNSTCPIDTRCPVYILGSIVVMVLPHSHSFMKHLFNQ